MTDGAYLTDGSGVVLRTYDGAVLYAMPGWEEVGEVQLPPQRQGESLAVIDGGPIMYVGTEGLPSPIQRVRIPAGIWRDLHPVPVEGVGGDVEDPVPATSTGNGVSPVAVVLGSSGLLIVLGVLWSIVHRRHD